MSTETQRKEFEKENNTLFLDFNIIADEYRDPLTQKFWCVWKSAQASQAAEIEALKADIATYVRAASKQATEIEALRKENEDMRAAAEKLHLVKIFMLGWKGFEPCKRHGMEQEVEQWITAFDELFPPCKPRKHHELDS